jgi:hypothetical protein
MAKTALDLTLAIVGVNGDTPVYLAGPNGFVPLEEDSPLLVLANGKLYIDSGGFVPTGLRQQGEIIPIDVVVPEEEVPHGD